MNGGQRERHLGGRQPAIAVKKITRSCVTYIKIESVLEFGSAVYCAIDAIHHACAIQRYYMYKTLYSCRAELRVLVYIIYIYTMYSELYIYLAQQLADIQACIMGKGALQEGHIETKWRDIDI